MFYRLKNENTELLDWADYKYSNDCLETDIITQSDLTKHPNKVIIQDGELVLNPDWDEIELNNAKQAKYYEALEKAKYFIDNEAVYQFDENNSIEATDGNIGKMTAYAMAFQTGTVDVVYWTSKEDNVLELHAQDILNILLGLGEIQSNVWNVQFVNYKNAIEQAQTVEEVEAIIIDYTIPTAEEISEVEESEEK